MFMFILIVNMTTNTIKVFIGRRDNRNDCAVLKVR